MNAKNKRFNFVGYLYHVEVSVFVPYLLKLTVGITPDNTQECFISYFEIDGKKVVQFQEAQIIEQKIFKEHWRTFEHVLYRLKNGEYKICWEPPKEEEYVNKQ